MVVGDLDDGDVAVHGCGRAGERVGDGERGRVGAAQCADGREVAARERGVDPQRRDLGRGEVRGGAVEAVQQAGPAVPRVVVAEQPGEAGQRGELLLGGLDVHVGRREAGADVVAGAVVAAPPGLGEPGLRERGGAVVEQVLGEGGERPGGESGPRLPTQLELHRRRIRQAAVRAWKTGASLGLRPGPRADIVRDIKQALVSLVVDHSSESSPTQPGVLQAVSGGTDLRCRSAHEQEKPWLVTVTGVTDTCAAPAPTPWRIIPDVQSGAQTVFVAMLYGVHVP